MSTLTEATSELKTPAGVILLPASVWATRWTERPTDEVATGVCVLPGAERESIIREAREHVQSGKVESTDVEEAFWLKATQLFVAAALCDPNDCTQPTAQLGQYAPMVIGARMTEAGARYAFDAIQRVAVESSPGHDEIDAEGIQDLADLLGAGALQLLSLADHSAVLRHLEYARSLLRDAVDQGGE